MTKYSTAGKSKIPKEFEELITSRVRPLLNRTGLETRSLHHLMSEAYRQGFIDAVEAARNPEPKGRHAAATT